MSDLTKIEAYLAMYSFLEKEYELTKSDDIGGLLGSMSLLENGETADPAVMNQWDKAIKKVKSNEIDPYLRIKK